MNPTSEKLKKLIPNLVTLGPDDPIYKEPAGIIFTGQSKRTDPKRKKPRANKPKKRLEEK